MAVKKRLKRNINIDEITVCVDTCPGCGHQHELRVPKPVTHRQCSYQKGTFIISVQSNMLKQCLELSVKFSDGYNEPFDITEMIRVEVSGTEV